MSNGSSEDLRVFYFTLDTPCSFGQRKLGEGLALHRGEDYEEAFCTVYYDRDDGLGCIIIIMVLVGLDWWSFFDSPLQQAILHNNLSVHLQFSRW